MNTTKTTKKMTKKFFVKGTVILHNSKKMPSGNFANDLWVEKKFLNDDEEMQTEIYPVTVYSDTEVEDVTGKTIEGDFYLGGHKFEVKEGQNKGKTNYILALRTPAKNISITDKSNS